MQALISAELTFLDFLQTLHTPLLDAVLIAASTLGNHGMVWILLAAALLLCPKTRRTGLAVALALLLMLVVCNLTLKPLFDRVRPFVLNPEVLLQIEPPDDASFPSGHTAASFAAAGALWRRRSRLRFPALVLAALIAFSRLYLYVHFPTDVLAGALLGLALGAAGSACADRMTAAWERRRGAGAR